MSKRLKYFEVLQELKPQIFRKLEDAYSEAGDLLHFRKVIETLHMHTGRSKEQIMSKINITYYKKGELKPLKPGTLEGIFTIAKLLGLIEIRQNLVFRKTREMAIIGCQRAPPGSDGIVRSLSNEEKLYFLPRILEREGNMILAFLSLINSGRNVNQDFSIYLRKMLDYLRQIYQSAKYPFASKIQKDITLLENELKGQPEVKRLDPLMIHALKLQEQYRRAMLPKLKRKTGKSTETDVATGPPTYEKRIAMIKGWCKDLQLVKTAGDLLSDAGENLINHPSLMIKRIDDFEIMILPPEKDILTAIFDKLPNEFKDKEVIKNSVRNDYFRIAGNAYGLTLTSKYDRSDTEFFEEVRSAYKIFKHGAFKQVNLDAIKELIDIKLAVDSNVAMLDFVDRIKRLQIARPNVVSTLSSPFGLGFIFLKQENG